MARMIRVFHRSDLANLALRVADWGWWINGWGGFFLVNFPQHRQIIKNIFLYTKNFHLKIFYTRKIFYILPNVA